MLVLSNAGEGNFKHAPTCAGCRTVYVADHLLISGVMQVQMHGMN